MKLVPSFRAAQKKYMPALTTLRLHWPFADPAGFEGTWEQKIAQTRTVREEIRNKISQWLNELKERA